MTEREQFEKAFPVPNGGEWSEALRQYCWLYTAAPHQHDAFWQVWQAARATPALPQATDNGDAPDEMSRLKDCLRKANEQAEHFEREWYLRGDEIEKLKALPQGAEAWAASGKDYDRNIHSNPDAKAWADFFMETFPNCGADHGTILGWFANAMMAMHDHLLSGMAIVPVDRITTIVRDVEYSPHTSKHTPFLRVSFAYDDYDSRDKVYAMLAAAKEQS